MILSNTKEAVQFLPSLNLTLENDRFTDFFRRAQAWLTGHIIGEQIENVLETPAPEGEEDHHKDLRLLCQRVIAERALQDAIPEMDLQLTEAGFAVQNNDDFSPASSQRVDRLIAKMPERIADDVDSLVRYMMKHSAGRDDRGTYSDWRMTDQFKYLTEAFMPLCEEYSAYINSDFLLEKKPSVNYDDFYAAIPMMGRELRSVADYYVSRAEIDRLVELYRNNDLLKIHRKAIVNLKDCAVAALRYDMNRARNAAIQAREVMMTDPDSFPAFKASPAYNTPTVNLNGGNLVNLL